MSQIYLVKVAVNTWRQWNGMDWTREQTQAEFQTDALDCLRWRMTSGDSLQAFALLAATHLRLSTWCLRKVEQAHEFCFLSRASATCIYLCHFFLLLNLNCFTCSNTHTLTIHSHTHTSAFFMSFLGKSTKHGSTCDQSSARYQRSRCMISTGARLCLSVWCPFMTWRYSVFTSHVSYFHHFTRSVLALPKTSLLLIWIQIKQLALVHYSTGTRGKEDRDAACLKYSTMHAN